MGRRAKKAPVKTKKRPTLAKRFKCPFCANDETVECKMDLRAGVGSLACRLCGASYQMPIHHLHEPIDVFSEWLDDCEAAQQGRPTGEEQQPTGRVGGASHGNGGGGGQRYGGGGGGPPVGDDSEEDDDLGQASGLSRPRDKAQGGGRDGDEEGRPKKKQATGERNASYTELGLDDSDEDSDED
mmetsp:Transcript_26627/g.37506  ORF Transcript_26627/g.37506 Transcript_26627/m.37506 type:complete len:184 (+) Transcript_26627:254-805(+)